MLSVETIRHPHLREVRALSVLTSAVFEHIQYGRTEYEHFITLCERFLTEHDMQIIKPYVLPNGWPDYDAYMHARCIDGNVFAHVDAEPPDIGEFPSE
jgi:hypothetical protein